MKTRISQTLKKYRNTLVSPRPILPNVILLGATRSGTTFLHGSLGRHPDIFTPQKKELEFFNSDQNYNHNLKAYHAEFKGYEAQKVILESTPLYFHKGGVFDKNRVFQDDIADDAVVRIARHIPDAKLIITLRNPIDRIVSEFEKNNLQGKENNDLNTIINDELSGEQTRFRYVYANRYEIHLNHVLEYFDRSQLLLLLFEDICEHPDAVIEQSLDFLNLPYVGSIENPSARNERSKYGSSSRQAGPYSSQLAPETRSRLQNTFATTRDYVEDLMNRSMAW